MLYYENLFGLVTSNVNEQNATKLQIISGYATAAMVRQHQERCPTLNISLMIGMTPIDGLSLVNHRGFLSLSGPQFSCSYNTGTPIHSKVYLWRNVREEPLFALVGSANYTQQALVLGQQQEILVECDPAEVSHYIDQLCTPQAWMDCRYPHVEDHVTISSQAVRREITRHPPPSQEGHPFSAASLLTDNIPYVDLPLTSSSGAVPLRSGLNWGQRDNRNRNQAYLSVPAHIARSGFFPPRAIRFNVMPLDTHEMMTMVVAQDGDKALETPYDNSLIGHYFRSRLGLPDGEFVTAAHLERYGRNTVRFFKVDNENYYMDF